MIASAVPMCKLPFLLNFYDFYSQFAFCRTQKFRLMRGLIIFMLLCSALSLPRKKNTKTLLIETMDEGTDDKVATSLQILIRPSFKAWCVQHSAVEHGTNYGSSEQSEDEEEAGSGAGDHDVLKPKTLSYSNKGNRWWQPSGYWRVAGGGLPYAKH